MNKQLIKTTEGKLLYWQTRVNDLTECLKSNLSKDCRHFTNDELDKAKKNVDYYQDILEILKERNDDLSVS